MKNITKIMAVLVGLCFTFNVMSADTPKGAQKMMEVKKTEKHHKDHKAEKKDKNTHPSITKTLWQSHSKQIGVIGNETSYNEKRYQVHQVKVRGLDTPNQTTTLVFDTKTDQLLVVGSVGGAGLGGAMISGAANAGAAYLFGASIRPSQTHVNNAAGSDSSSSSKAGSNSEGGAGGSANSTSNGGNSTSNSNGGSSQSNSDATGGTGNGGQGGRGGNATSNNRGGNVTVTPPVATPPRHIPPGHINNPGHGNNN